MEEKIAPSVFFEWIAPTRYFEKKPDYYLKAIVALGVLLSLLLFFFAEYVLIFAVWTCIFVLYLRATVAPLETTFKLTKFGLQYYDTSIDYKTIRAFSVSKKKVASVARFFVMPHGEIQIVLPHERQRELIHFLQEKIPFIEQVPETDSERIARWLKHVIGLH